MMPSPLNTLSMQHQSSTKIKKDQSEYDEEISQRKALLQIEHRRIQDKRKRQKKSDDELNILENEFLKSPTWDY